MNGTQEGLIGVYGLWYQPWWHSWAVWVAIGLILGGMLWYALFWRVRKVKKLTIEQEVLQELHRLRSANYATQQSLHDAYFRLTMAIKNYLAARFNVVLSDKADIQVVSMLDGIMDQNMLLLLQEFFDRSFRIKFAYDAVSETMLMSDIDMLHDLVVQTSKQSQTTENT